MGIPYLKHWSQESRAEFAQECEIPYELQSTLLKQDKIRDYIEEYYGGY